jgi:hypothetical protein
LRNAPVAELRAARFVLRDGRQQFETLQGDPCWVQLEVYFHSDALDPIFAIALQNERGGTAFAASTQLTHGATGHFRAGTTAEVLLRFDNWLAPGQYRLFASVARDGGQVDAYDARQDISSVVVHASKSGGGAVDLPHTFEIKRS